MSRENAVDPALADAFDTDGDESDDEADDRQRLVRGNSFPVSTDSTAASPGDQQRPAAAPSALQVADLPSAANAAGSRVYGGGIQADGVFSNLSARPELSQGKEEQPPVCASSSVLTIISDILPAKRS